VSSPAWVIKAAKPGAYSLHLPWEKLADQATSFYWLLTHMNHTGYTAGPAQS